MDILTYMMLFCMGIGAGCLVLAPLVKLTDWLQDKLDEINKQVDEQLNNAEQ